MFGLSRNKDQESAVFVLSGYITPASYESRIPDFEDDMEYATFDEAMFAAQNWYGQNGDQATAEIIKVSADRGDVKAVIDSNGTEIIN